jgi:hypothetical protein
MGGIREGDGRKGPPEIFAQFGGHRLLAVKGELAEEDSFLLFGLYITLDHSLGREREKTRSRIREMGVTYVYLPF